MRIEPTAVGCMRGNLRTGFTYDAEIGFGYGGGNHKLISTGHNSHEEAVAAAQGIVDKIITDIQAVLEKHLAQYKDAKP